jgi:hypothetical protein
MDTFLNAIVVLFSMYLFVMIVIILVLLYMLFWAWVGSVIPASWCSKTPVPPLLVLAPVPIVPLGPRLRFLPVPPSGLPGREAAPPGR